MNAYDLTYKRYCALIRADSPGMPEADIEKKAKLMADDWKARRDDGCVERSVTEYDIWGNV